MTMRWRIANKFDRVGCGLADRHYSRRKIGSPQFVPPGRSVVLVTKDRLAYWVTSWPFAEYVRHAWPGAWICSAFRNEGAGLSSELITEAVSATRWHWPDIPDLGMITFVDPGKVRKKRDPGRCFRRAGFSPCGETKGGLFALQLLPGNIPPASPPDGVTLGLCLTHHHED